MAAAAVLLGAAHSRAHPGEDGGGISFDIGSEGKTAEISVEGFWKSLVTGSGSVTFGFGTAPEAELSSPALTQEVDLDMHALYDGHWFFDASFADGFDRNTVSAGFRGDGAIKEIKVSNRGITFPDTYSVSETGNGIGGGANEAPGIMGHFEGDGWRGDFALRYEFVEAETADWFGMNSAVTSKTSLENWLTGASFTIPSAGLSSMVDGVFVESADGGESGSDGLSYKKLSASQFVVSAREKRMLIARDAGAGKKSGRFPAVAVSFRNGALGSEQAAIEEFLEETEEWFGRDISGFSFAKTDGISGYLGEIGGTTVLFLQRPDGFSPFWDASRYDLGTTPPSDAFVASSSTEIADTSFEAEISEDDTGGEFFDEGHSYADVSAKDGDGSTASARFPLARTNPGIYLGYGDAPNSENDNTLLSRTLSPVKSLSIGTSAIAGTVRVYRNGILEHGAEFDADTGTISLQSPVSAGDRIHAEWLENSGDTDEGSVSFGAGIEKEFLPFLKADVSAAGRWTYAYGKEYADADGASAGFLAAAAGAGISTEHLRIRNSASLSLVAENTTGILRILGMDDDENGTEYLEKDAAHDIPEGILPVIGGEELDESLKGGGAGKARKDVGISGYAVPLEFDFTGFPEQMEDGSSEFWAAAAVELEEASSLASCSSFQIALKNESEGADGIEIYLQLGAEAADSIDEEFPSLIPSWSISRLCGTLGEGEGWKVATVALTDEERAGIARTGHHDARIIVTSKKRVSGTILVGPYELHGSHFTADTDGDARIASETRTDASLKSARVSDLNRSTNKVQSFSWEYGGGTTDEDGAEIRIARYFDGTDISGYKRAIIFAKIALEDERALGENAGEGGTMMTVSLEDSAKNTAARFALPRSSYDTLGDGWHEFAVDLDKSSLFVDGEKLEGAEAEADKSVVPSKIAISLTPISGDGTKIAGSGTLMIDELHLDGAEPHLEAADKARAEFEAKGTIASAGGTEILANAYTSLSSDLSLSSDGASVGAGAKAGIDITGIRFEAAAAKSPGAGKITQASHKIATVSPLLGIISASESFSLDSESRASSKDDSLSLKKGAMSAGISLSSSADTIAMRQNASMKAEFAGKSSSVSAAASLSEKTSAASSAFRTAETGSYASSYSSATAMQFSKGSAGATRRDLSASFSARTGLTAAGIAIRPAFSASTKAVHKSSSKFSDTTASSISVPLSAGAHTLTLSAKHEFGGTEEADMKAHADDASLLARALSRKAGLIPLVSPAGLFSPSAKKIVSGAKNAGGEITAAFYTASCVLGWKRAFSATAESLLLPTSAEISVTRNIRAEDSESDIYKAGLKIGNSFMNAFGKSGLIPIFGWYEQDEFRSSLSLSAKIPREDPGSASFSAAASIRPSILINGTDSVSAAAEGSAEGRDDWSVSVSASWKRRSGKSLTKAIASLLFRGVADGTIRTENTKTDSLSFKAGSTSPSSSKKSPVRKYAASCSHSVDTKVGKNITMHTSLALSYESTWGTSATLGASATAGFTLRF